MPSSPPGTTDRDARARRHELVFLGLIAACLMLQPLSTDLYLASLPPIARYFDATPAQAQQTLSYFVIGFGLAQLISGPMSDRYGRRPVLLGGLAIYALASLACAAAPSLPMLVAGRLLQSLGCCTAVVIARAIVRDAHEPAEGARIVATATAVMSLAPLLGPVAGAQLQVSFGWRAPFVLLGAFGCALLAATWFHLAETNRQPTADALHPAGLARGYGEILRVPAFWSYTLPGALSYGSVFVFISGVSFVLTNILHVSTAWFGLVYALGVSGFFTGTVACRRIIAARGVAPTAALGARLSLAAGVLFPLVMAAGLVHWSTVILFQFCVMFAHGINWPCAQVGAVAPFGQRAGAAAGLLGFLAMAAALAVGTWIGRSYDGSLLPMSLTSAAMGVLIFASSQALARHRA